MTNGKKSKHVQCGKRVGGTGPRRTVGLSLMAGEENRGPPWSGYRKLTRTPGSSSATATTRSSDGRISSSEFDMLAISELAGP